MDAVNVDLDEMRARVDATHSIITSRQRVEACLQKPSAVQGRLHGKIALDLTAIPCRAGHDDSRDLDHAPRHR